MYSAAEHLECCDPQAMGLLQHLKSYKRISPPSDVENTHHLENGLLPSPLSSRRLPFHLLMQIKHFWKIICELSVNMRLNLKKCIVLYSHFQFSF